MSKTLYIIDGHAQIYAAFYAPMAANLTAPSGEPTKATFIFTTMLLKLLRERRPDMIAVAMDAPGPSFRHEIYPEYKANRPPMPDDLIRQLDRIDKILAAMNIPVLRQAGYEADDLIGTLATKAAAMGLQVYICSNDKDLEQLLCENVKIFDPKSGTETDTAALLEKKGLRPDQVVDLLALQGDTSDNVPGVPDVGPKTALQWLQKFGSLQELLVHQDQIKGKRGNNLRAGLEQLQLSRELVQINRQVPLEINWDNLTLEPFNRKALDEIFQQLGFRKLSSQLDSLTQAQTGKKTDETSSDTADFSTTSPTADKAEYHLVDSPEAFEDFLKKLKKQKIFALDTETTSTNPVEAELVGLSFAWQNGLAFYLPIKTPLGQKCLDRRETLKKLEPILSNPEIKKIGQNIKYDMIILRRAGVELQGVAFDTMVASYILNSSREHHNLDSLALDFLGHETIKLHDLIGKGKNQLTFDMVDTRLAADYAAEDAEVTWRLAEYFQKQMTDEELRRLFEQIEIPLVAVLAEMEHNGVALDVPSLRKMNTQLAQRMEQLVAQIHQQAGCSFNVDSPKQLAQVLFDKLQLPPTKRTKSGRSTNQEVLEALSWQHPIAKLMLEYRQLSKLKNTYVDKLPGMIFAETNRLHASFNQTVAVTGRLSSSNPNLQNIPVRTQLGQEIRRAFVPADKNSVILSADYSQIELRLLAHFSRDQALTEAFTRGQDIHRYVAAQVHGIDPEQVDQDQRSQAKAVNFGIIYGQTAYGLSRGIGMPVEQAQRFIDDYFARYPTIKTFIYEVIEKARRQGHVRTILGRRRVILDINSQNHNRRRLAERMAVNTVIQGSAADLIKAAMINIFRRIKRQKLLLKLLLQVHDELVFELPRDRAPQYARLIREEMATAIKLDVPITVDVGWGKNWLECK